MIFFIATVFTCPVHERHMIIHDLYVEKDDSPPKRCTRSHSRGDKVKKAEASSKDSRKLPIALRHGHDSITDLCPRRDTGTLALCSTMRWELRSEERS